MTVEGNERTFEDNRIALCLDYSGGYMIYMCQNTPNCIFKRVNFSVYKLYINKPNLKKLCRLLKAFNISCQIALPLT